MTGTVQILDVTRGLFRDKVVLLALTPCGTVWDSLMGEREFYLNQGSRIRVSVGKRLYQQGEQVPFNQVCTSGNAFDFSWRWRY